MAEGTICVDCSQAGEKPLKLKEYKEQETRKISKVPRGTWYLTLKAMKNPLKDIKQMRDETDHSFY